MARPADPVGGFREGSVMWGYAEALDWLYGRQALGIKLGLDKVRRLLAMLGDPQDSFVSVHVAGTNGKGSVCRMMAETLRRSGLRTGCTTSPHLVSFRERIDVDGTPISEQAVAFLLAALRPAVAILDREGQSPTFFEVVTALAFLYFREMEVQWAVVETGMGGRLDATNVLDPALTIITNVELDHKAQLGDTVGLIAYEKAGIMKPGIPCVTAAQGEALRVLMARSHEVGCPMSIVGRDYRVVPDPRHLVLLRPNGESVFAVGLAGAHQHENSAVVVAGVEALQRQGLAIPDRALRDALASTRHPGRLETFKVEAGELAPGATGQTTILVDGAHNPAAARALRSHLDATGWTGFHLVAGFCADKEWREALAQWVPLASSVTAVPVRNPRSLAPEALAQEVRAHGIPCGTASDVTAALNQAAARGAGRILVCGSLFLAGEARAVLTGAPVEEIRGRQ
jgi:dihydrofolate synthase/folylpolyglutamate synthase